MKISERADATVHRLGVAVKYWRALRQISQHELAAAAGVAVSTVGMVETGKRSEISTLARLAYALGIDLKDLVESAEYPQDRLIQSRSRIVKS